MAFDPIENGESGSSVRAKINALGESAAPLAGTEMVLFKLDGADMNSTADQAFTKLGDFGDYIIFRVTALDASVSLSGAIGGIYTEPSKGGVQIVANSYAWGNLNNTEKYINATLAPSAMAKLSETPILSLTTPLGVDGACDILIIGMVKP